MAYRQTKKGRNQDRRKKLGRSSSSYLQIYRRVNKLDISPKRSDDDEDDKDIIIAIYITGIKVTNRGPQCIQQEKWNVKNKGYLKIHVAVDVNTKEILAYLGY